MSARPSALVIALALAAACGGGAPTTGEPTAPLPPDAPPDDTADDEVTLDALVLAAPDPGANLDDAAPVHAALVRQRAPLDACYRAALAAVPRLAGDVRLSLEISRVGEVVGARSEPAGGRDGVAAVAGCLVREARALRFPARATAGVTRVHIPVVLRPEDRT